MNRMTSKELTQLKKAIKAKGYQVNVVRCGAGKYQSMLLSGAHTEVLSGHLVKLGYTVRNDIGRLDGGGVIITREGK